MPAMDVRPKSPAKVAEAKQITITFRRVNANPTTRCCPPKNARALGTKATAATTAVLLSQWMTSKRLRLSAAELTAKYTLCNIYTLIKYLQ